MPFLVGEKMTTTSNLSMEMLDDPIFYIYLIGVLFYIPSFISQFILSVQIWKHNLTNNLSENLLINIGCWVIYLFLGLSCGEFFCLFAFECVLWVLVENFSEVFVDCFLIRTLGMKNYDCLVF
jgi:hypothetical protein